MHKASTGEPVTREVRTELDWRGYHIGSDERYTIAKDPRAHADEPAPEYTLVGVDETGHAGEPVIWLRLRPVGAPEASGAFSVNIARVTKLAAKAAA